MDHLCLNDVVLVGDYATLFFQRCRDERRAWLGARAFDLAVAVRSHSRCRPDRVSVS